MQSKVVAVLVSQPVDPQTTPVMHKPAAENVLADALDDWRR
jgi:hypothetical protein